jgi:proteasome lid subunit RPN8/RPN11
MIEPVPKPVPTNPGATEVIGSIHADALPVFVREQTLEQILDFSESQPERERGGFLVGGFHIDETAYVEIRHFLAATATYSRAASLTFTHDTWSQLHRQVELDYPGERVVGWHHTHPNFGIFLSAYDRFVHRHFFSAAWQVALVVDPQRQELGCFQWRNDQITDCGFYCVRELVRDSVSPELFVG